MNEAVNSDELRKKSEAKKLVDLLTEEQLDYAISLLRQLENEE